MIGQTISHYRIVEKLGEGGMGVVYKAEDLTLDRHVALKFLSHHLTSDESAKTRFIREAKAASALEHPNICSIYEIHQAPDGRLFTVMPCYEGETLRGRLDDGPLEIDEALDVATQVASGLARAHEKGIVHRDIKPGNVMLTDGRRQAKLMDFGLAKRLDATKVTRTGMTVGTIAYMSPEQALGKETDQRTDIWSLGVMLYEMLAGRLPFRGDVEPALLYSLINEEPESVTAARKDVPVQVEMIIEKALSKDVEKRYQGMEELLRDLEEQRDKWALGIKERHFVTLRRRTRRRLLRVLVPSAAVGLAALAVFVYQKIKPIPPEAIAQENSMAIMYFENMADPEDEDRTAEMITELLTNGLGRSEYIKVVSRQRVHDIVKQLGKEGQNEVDRDTASEVAKRAGVNWAMTGTVIQTEPNLVVTADIWHSLTGEVRATQRIRGETGEDIFAAVDKLIQGFKEDLSLPEATLNRAVADVTTHSEEALRYYLEGVDQFFGFYWPEARESFTRALEIDSTFAMASLRLGVAYACSHLWGEVGPAIAQAARHAEKVSERERLYIEAWANMSTQGIKGFEYLLERFPDEKEAHYWLGLFYFWQVGDPEKAAFHFEKSVELDPSYKIAYNDVIPVYLGFGDFEKASWAVDRQLELAPDEPHAYDVKSAVLAYGGKLDAAIQYAEKALDMDPGYLTVLRPLGDYYVFKKDFDKAENCFKRLTSCDDAQLRSRGRRCLAKIPLYQGKLEDALEVLSHGIAADEMEGFHGEESADKHVLKAIVYREKGDLDLALDEMEVALDILRSHASQGSVRYQYYYVDYYIELLLEGGELKKARELIEKTKNAMLEKGVSLSAGYAYWRGLGLIERAEGNIDSALTHITKATQTGMGIELWPHFTLAETYFETGKLDEAVAAFEGILSRYPEHPLVNPILAVKSHYLLGLTYEQTQRPADALEQYDEFLDIWKDADPVLEEVEDAKRRSSGLKAKM